MEWLVANRAAEQLNHQAGERPAVDALGQARMSPLMADFFCGLAGEAAEPWAQAVVETQGTDLGEHAKQNALLVLERLGKEARSPVQLAGEDLRGKDLSNRNLAGAACRALTSPIPG